MSSDLLESIDARTKLVGKNRFEALIFKLYGKRFAVNVFKIREVMDLPRLYQFPGQHPAVMGVAHVRGQPFSVIDTSLAIANRATEEFEGCKMIITEFNRSVQALLVHELEYIANLSWEEIELAPEVAGDKNYITGIIKSAKDEDEEDHSDSGLIQVLDVETILAEITGDYEQEKIDQITVEPAVVEQAHDYTVLAADDSITARRNIKQALDKVGVNVVILNDGRQAFQYLLDDVKKGVNIHEKYLAVIADVEMPEVDGYTLIKKCREHEALKDLFIMLNTSITSVFSDEDIASTDCNVFVGKIDSHKIIDILQAQLKLKKP